MPTWGRSESRSPTIASGSWRVLVWGLSMESGDEPWIHGQGLSGEHCKGGLHRRQHRRETHLRGRKESYIYSQLSPLFSNRIANSLLFQRFSSIPKSVISWFRINRANGLSSSLRSGSKYCAGLHSVVFLEPKFPMCADEYVLMLSSRDGG